MLTHTLPQAPKQVTQGHTQCTGWQSSSQPWYWCMEHNSSANCSPQGDMEARRHSAAGETQRQDGSNGCAALTGPRIKIFSTACRYVQWQHSAVAQPHKHGPAIHHLRPFLQPFLSSRGCEGLPPPPFGLQSVSSHDPPGTQLFTALGHRRAPMNTTLSVSHHAVTAAL